MKALLVADNDVAIENISQILKSAGYDPIVYRWLLKALDNIEEIAPHLIVMSTADYPRHWKTLAQYASSGFGDYTPQVILYTDENFSEEEQKKADALHVRGTFNSIGVDGLDKLREILSKSDDIFSGHLTEGENRASSADSGKTDESFDELLTKFKETSGDGETVQTEPTLADIERAQIEAEDDAKAADKLAQIAEDERAADRLEEIAGDEKAADKLERIAGNEEILTVADVLREPYEQSEDTTLPGIDKLREFLSAQDVPLEEKKNFEESEKNDKIEEIEEETTGENTMADEQSIDDKLAEIMNANKADAKEKAEALKLNTAETGSVSFVFTNPITLAMVSGVARNYNGLVLEFTPDIPTFIMNLSPGTKIDIASMKIDDKIENVFAEVMSNDAKKLALAIKKIS